MREHADLLDKTLPSFHTKGKTFGNVLLSPFLTKVPGYCRVCECLELRGSGQEESPFPDLDTALAESEGAVALGHSGQFSVCLRVRDSSLGTPNPLKRISKDEILAGNSGSYENSADVYIPVCCCLMTPASPLSVLRLSQGVDFSS